MCLGGGDRAAFDRLRAAVYPELREMARARLRDQRAGHTLNPTGLVHEAYLRLVRYQDVSWKGRAHFLGNATGDPLLGLAVTALHTLGYLLVMGLIAVVVYEKLGLRLLRTHWLNLDVLWAVALILTAALTLIL